MLDTRTGQRAVSVLTVSAILLAIVLVASIALYFMQTSAPNQETVKPSLEPQKPSPKGPKEIPPPTTVVIKAVSRAEFAPGFVDISVGSTVIWENIDAEAHTATSNNVTADGSPLFHSVLNPRDKFEFRINKPGTYRYYCVIAFHEMNGIIRVRG